MQGSFLEYIGGFCGIYRALGIYRAERLQKIAEDSSFVDM